MGQAILEAIRSGLGLITDIAKEFMSGFQTLLWDSTANSGAGALTSFGNFAFIMLGIGVTFTVVSLVLNLVRGRTGI